jgi:hypothetical protein
VRKIVPNVHGACCCVCFLDCVNIRIPLKGCRVELKMYECAAALFCQESLPGWVVVGEEVKNEGSEGGFFSLPLFRSPPPAGTAPPCGRRRRLRPAPG